MSQPFNPAITASPTIHTPPPSAPSPVNAPTPQYIGVIGSVILDLILAQIAIALGNVTVLGQRPFAFLSEWGRELQQRAQDAFANAQIAQGSANFANSQLAILTGGGLASDVAGGVSLSDQFVGASANNLGASWTRASEGSGAGNFGPNGAGQAVWKKSGGLARIHIDRHNTPLATDYQAVFIVLSAPPQSPSFGSESFTFLLARMEDEDTFVWLRISHNQLTVGKRAGGSWSTWVSVSATVAAGDSFTFYVGTDSDDREVIVKQNGVAKITHTDATSSAFGASYRYVGIASEAKERNFLTDQTVPASLEVWSASDRLPATV